MAKRKNSPAKTPTHYTYDETAHGQAVRGVWNLATKHAKKACVAYEAVDVQTAKGLRDLALKCMPDGWAIGAKVKPTEASGPLGGYAIECDGVRFAITDRPGKPGIRVKVPAKQGVTQTLKLQVAGRKFALDSAFGEAITEATKPKASAKTRKATSKAKADAVAKGSDAERMANLREILAMFPDATLAEAMSLLNA